MNREKYSDGRLVPIEGDEVYQAVRGAFGMPAYIHGLVKKRGKKLVIEIESSAAFIGSGPPKGKTYQLTPYWTVLKDPEITRREEEKKAAAKAEEDSWKREQEEGKKRAKESRKKALEQEGHKEIDPKSVKPGDKVIMHTSAGRRTYFVTDEGVELETGGLGRHGYWIYVSPNRELRMGGGGYPVSVFTVPPSSGKLKNPFLEAAATGLGFGAGLFGMKKLFNQKNPSSVFSKDISWEDVMRSSDRKKLEEKARYMRKMGRKVRISPRGLLGEYYLQEKKKNPIQECPHCSAVLRAKGHGKYRCPGCQKRFRRVKR